MRKSIVIIAILALVSGGLYVYADNPAMAVSTVNGSKGQVVEINISITGNPGVAMFKLRLEFDKESLTPISIAKGAVLSSGVLSSNIQAGKTTDLDYVTAIWYDTVNTVADGILFTVKFHIEDTAVGHIPLIVTYKTGDIFNEDLEPVTFITTGGEVYVESSIDENTPPNVSGSNNTAGEGTITAPNISIDNYGAGNAEHGIRNESPELTKFTDLIDYPWAANEIIALASKGIVNGTSATTFSPATIVKRADYLVLLVRMLGLTAEYTDNFDDVPQNVFYYHEIGIAKALGLITGVGNNRFNPEEEITRQDVFVLTYRILVQLEAIESSDDEILAQFADSEQIADYAIEALAALVSMDIVKGNNSCLYPLAHMTRAEMAVFVWRIGYLVL